MIPFVSKWLDARVRRIVREELGAVRFDARGIVSAAEHYQRQAVDRAVAAMKHRELTHG